MTTVCIVLHAEGPGELGNPSWEVPPGESLSPEEQGPAHIIVQRVLADGAQLPEKAIDFREPFRTKAGVRAYGSKLLDSRVLDEILVGWLLNPPLVILIVDSDDSHPSERIKLLEQALERNCLEGAVGVAVKEFEAWLIADSTALSNVLRGSKNSPPNPEALSCKEAKQLLNGWINESVTSNRGPVDIRKELASVIDLDEVSKLCPSFKDFRQALLQMNIQ